MAAVAEESRDAATSLAKKAPGGAGGAGHVALVPLIPEHVVRIQNEATALFPLTGQWVSVKVGRSTSAQSLENRIL